MPEEDDVQAVFELLCLTHFYQLHVTSDFNCLIAWLRIFQSFSSLETHCDVT